MGAGLKTDQGWISLIGLLVEWTEFSSTSFLSEFCTPRDGVVVVVVPTWSAALLLPLLDPRVAKQNIVIVTRHYQNHQDRHCNSHGLIELVVKGSSFVKFESSVVHRKRILVDVSVVVVIADDDW